LPENLILRIFRASGEAQLTCSASFVCENSGMTSIAQHVWWKVPLTVMPEDNPPFWIRDPGIIWVSDDRVYALVSVLERSLTTLDSISRALQFLPSPSPQDFLIHSTPSPNLDHARRAVRDSVDDARWLRSALIAYAEATAAQERARVMAWNEPWERVAALWVATLAGSDPAGSLGDNPVGHAAGSLGSGFSRTHLVEVVESPLESPRVVPPTSWAERMDRIPPTASPIRIERYVDTSGAVSTEVYLAGTHDWGIATSEHPFDMHSNIALLAGLPAASLASVTVALRRAGVMPGEKVTFTGHSQGGVIAARLAESGTYRTQGLLVVGAPLGTITIQGSYPALALRHTDDIVPLLGGSDLTTGITTVERESGAPFGDVAGAHTRERYREMARDLELSPAADYLPPLPVAEGNASSRLFSASRVSP